MNPAEFWAIIEPTIAYRLDQDGQRRALEAELSKLSLDDIVAFDGEFQRMLRAAYSWELWGAAYVVNGGASDDGFEYFRRWLIAQGERAYRKVLSDPDALGDLVALGDYEWL